MLLVHLTHSRSFFVCSRMLFAILSVLSKSRSSRGFILKNFRTDVDRFGFKFFFASMALSKSTTEIVFSRTFEESRARLFSRLGTPLSRLF